MALNGRPEPDDRYSALVQAQRDAGAAVGGDPFLLPMPTADDDAGWNAVRREYFRLAGESGGTFPHFILDSEHRPDGTEPTI
jgi:hypothetical protein